MLFLWYQPPLFQSGPRPLAHVIRRKPKRRDDDDALILILALWSQDD